MDLGSGFNPPESNQYIAVLEFEIYPKYPRTVIVLAYASGRRYGEYLSGVGGLSCKFLLKPPPPPIFSCEHQKSKGENQDLRHEGVNLTFREAKRHFEAKYLEDLLRRIHGNMALASRSSMVGRPYLYKKIKEHGIQPEMFRDR